MYLTSDLSLLVSYLLTLVLNFDLSTGEHMQGGYGGGVVLITNNKPSKYQSDMLLITGQKGCSPTIIKTGSKTSKNMVIVGGCNNQHKTIKKEIIPVPMPYKEYIPVPYMKEETKPIIVNIKQPRPLKMPMKMEYGNGYGNMHMDMGLENRNVPVIDMSMDSLINDMMSMGSKKSITVVTKDKTDKMDNKKLKPRKRKSPSLFKLNLK